MVWQLQFVIPNWHCLPMEFEEIQNHVRNLIFLVFYFHSNWSSSDSAWSHRAWIVNRFEVDRDAELALCRDFLKADQRNFHCWAYRRFVSAAAVPVPPHVNDSGEEIIVNVAQEEFDYSTEKIAENFSNYSSFHHRSVYLRQLSSVIDDPRSKQTLTQELAIVENAVFTEPDDQSAWWYHQFLLVWSHHNMLGASDEDITWFRGVLEGQLDVMRSLLELETASKWAMTCIVNLIDVIVRSCPHLADVDDALVEERTSFLMRLIEVDNMHVHRYQYLLNKST
jgi:geranylgeranyl transferase type-2 subunit alpha